MESKWRDAGHLIRPALVFAAGTMLFLVLRAMVVPESFGLYGHYRADALNEIRAHPPVFAGQAVCAGCHPDQAAEKEAGKHASVSCEACHGPAAAHAEDPAQGRPPKPEAASLCPRCHEADAARPKWFRQVVSSQHSGGVSCEGCHQPHSPKM